MLSDHIEDLTVCLWGKSYLCMNLSPFKICFDMNTSVLKNTQNNPIGKTLNWFLPKFTPFEACIGIPSSPKPPSDINGKAGCGGIVGLGPDPQIQWARTDAPQATFHLPSSPRTGGNRKSLLCVLEQCLGCSKLLPLEWPPSQHPMTCSLFVLQ